MNKLPKVSVLTPLTYDRIKFKKMMMMNILNQDYPHELIEWVVVGDEKEETKSTFENLFKKMNISCKYIPCNITNDIGKKRNFCVENSSHKILVNMDSDDIYIKSFLSYSISELRSRKKGIVGCKDLMILFPEIRKVKYIIGNGIHEGTSTFTKKYWKTIKYKEGVRYAEGSLMSKGSSSFNELDIRKVMICVSHDNNTFDKSKFIDYPDVKIPEHDIIDIITYCT